jgi:hypothetical protein
MGKSIQHPPPVRCRDMLSPDECSGLCRSLQSVLIQNQDLVIPSHIYRDSFR